MKRIYLDNAATTPVLPEAVAAMMPYFGGVFGNPSAKNAPGAEARAALEKARSVTAGKLGLKEGKTVFTSGGTESNMIGVVGSVLSSGRRGGSVICGKTEHRSVLDACRLLGRLGYDIIFAGVDGDGLTDPDEIADLIRDDTLLVTVMYANNETGVIQPVKRIARICHEKNVPMYTDAVQCGDPSDVVKTGADMFGISGHKLGAPKGSGLFYTNGKAVRGGAGQEYGIRPGTENVAFAAALSAAVSSGPPENTERLRSVFESAVTDGLPGTVINGSGAKRVPGISSMSFEGVEAEGLLFALSELGTDAAAGSACTSDERGSHVLSAMGLTERQADSTVRFSFGRQNTEEEVMIAADAVIKSVKKLRKIR